ncbi:MULTISPECIES: host-nuclease inhibitor Gam family protein [unclassified Sporosarcina]|uniref:host-nuclease inhibitor Gam family protein n=1 Tax=unclassified Sporosarcina TaxID=2647733 RepID=UPI00203A8B6A|nr:MULTISPECIES: host-nuclease inhibitor Gam family protein [unclassified Sporosarcina]GKV65479.1 phage protein [Sporosarcina sp. NCCP-2331]GLB55603.1 phage protein [Sporosarcina sp. NCCP-2378]
MNVIQNEEVAEVEEKERFEITDESSLHWTFRKMRELKGEIAEKEELAKLEYDRIDEDRKLVDVWLEKETNPLLQSIEYFDHLIREYHMTLLSKDDSKKTLSTPYGESKTTTTAEQPDKADDEKLLEYVKENNLTKFLKVEESVRWGELKKSLMVSGENVVDESGEIVKGVKVKPKTVNYKIELN